MILDHAITTPDISKQNLNQTARHFAETELLHTCTVTKLDRTAHIRYVMSRYNTITEYYWATPTLNWTKRYYHRTLRHDTSTELSLTRQYSTCTSPCCVEQNYYETRPNKTSTT